MILRHSKPTRFTLGLGDSQLKKSDAGRFFGIFSARPCAVEAQRTKIAEKFGRTIHNGDVSNEISSHIVLESFLCFVLLSMGRLHCDWFGCHISIDIDIVHP